MAKTHTQNERITTEALDMLQFGRVLHERPHHLVQDLLDDAARCDDRARELDEQAKELRRKARNSRKSAKHMRKFLETNEHTR